MCGTVWRGGKAATASRHVPSVPDLIAAIEDYLATHNDPQPLTRTPSADSILTKVARGRVPETGSQFRDRPLGRC